MPKPTPTEPVDRATCEHKEHTDFGYMMLCAACGAVVSPKIDRNTAFFKPGYRRQRK